MSKMSPLDKKLQELALTEWELFCTLTGVDKTQAFVCLERQRGLSYQQIGNKLKISKQSVAERCKKCQRP